MSTPSDEPRDAAAPAEGEGQSDPVERDPVDRVRRRFLLAGGAYVAPAILASFALGSEAYGACPPYINNCDPFRSCAPGRCGPAINPCAPVQPGGG